MAEDIEVFRKGMGKMTTKKELLQRQAALQAEMDKLNKAIEGMLDDKPAAGRWKPEQSDAYFYLSGNGDIGYSFFNSQSNFDPRAHALGNCYPTREAAERALDRLKVHYELMDLNGGFVPDWQDVDEKRWALYLSFDNELDMAPQNYQFPNTVYFRSEEEARAAVEKVGESRVIAYCKGE